MSTRAVGAVAIGAALVIGGCLIYLGTRDNGQPGFERHLPELTTSNPNGGVAVGRMHLAGGPGLPNGRTHDQQLQGVVFIYRDDDPKLITQADVDTTGSFMVSLPAGAYKFVAHPNLAGIAPFDAHASVKAGKTTIVDLVAIAT